MFPGFISYYLGAKISSGRAAVGGLACTLGILTLFSMIGALSSLVGGVVKGYLPLLQLVAGAVMIFMGVVALSQVKLPTFLGRLKAPKRRGTAGLFLYGVVYGLATLGCSAPIFFSVLFWAVAEEGLASGLIVFLVYAAGMGLPLTVTTVLATRAKEVVARRVSNASSMIQKASSVALIIVGASVVYLYFIP